MTHNNKKKPPRYLYRYRPSLDERNQLYTERLFVHHELGFSSPAALNDPFDCRSFELTWEGTTEEQRERHLREVAKGNPAFDIEQENSWVEEQLKNKSYMAKEHLQGKKNHIINKINVECRILCLTEKKNDILMWSHYSTGHRGFCLIFDTTKDKELFRYAEKVNYPDTRDYPKVNFSYDKDLELKVLATKSYDWKYEKEWRRLLVPKDRKKVKDGDLRPVIKTFKKESLIGVIFGYEMANEDKDKIREWAKEGELSLKYYKTDKKENKFGLDILPEED